MSFHPVRPLQLDLLLDGAVAASLRDGGLDARLLEQHVLVPRVEGLLRFTL